MKEIKIGHTNWKKVRDGDKFIIYKTKNQFNHNIDYKLLKEFNFVPKLLAEDDEKIVWQFIDGKMLDVPTDEDLKQIATNLRVLHKSNLLFPKNNLRKRYNHYLKIAHQKNIKMPEVELNWHQMNKLVSRMNKINPCHNDLWSENILKDKQGKIWFVDWEYATMGDKHFDLAFLIDSYPLDERQKQIFYQTYNSFDDYWAYIPEWMPRYLKFVNWLTLVWANAQPKLPFDLAQIRKKVNEL